MPIYEYQCDKCGAKVERIHGINEKKRVACERCGRSMKRLISPSAFILKGSGWYVTDYPSKSRKEGMEKEKQSTAKSTDSNGKKTKKKKKAAVKKSGS